MESLAAVLRRIPVFADLPRGSFAKIIADLREERHAPGTVLCYEGDEALDFYIIKSGFVEVLVNRGANQRELVAVNGPNDWFGERALFSDRPRSATVVTRTEVEVWRLAKEKFDELIEENPSLILHFTQVISDRLYRGNQELSKVQSAFTRQMDALLNQQPEPQRAFLTASAILTDLDPTVLGELLEHDDAAPLLAELEAQGIFVVRQDGRLMHLEAVQEFLLTTLRKEIGVEGVCLRHRAAAQLYDRLGRWEQALEHHLAAGDVRVAARSLAVHMNELLGSGRLDSAQRWLARIPKETIEEFLPELSDQVENVSQSTGNDFVTVFLRGEWKPQIDSSGAKWFGALAGVAGAVAIAQASPPAGLGPAGMHMLGSLTWAVAFWAFDVLPDYVVGLGLIMSWILFGIVPPDIAVSGFTTGPFFLIIGVLGIAASLQSSGLLFRLALQVLRRFPLTYRGQAMGLALSGTAISSAIPDVTSGVAIAGPIILAQAESLGYARRSNGSAGLAMAAVLGFGQMSPFFLTGAAENLLAWGLLPETARAEISWIGWLVAALPLALVTFVAGFAATMLLFPPEFQPTISRGLIETQIEALGKPSRAEVVNAVVLVLAMIGWITGPYHGVDAAWVAMTGLAVLLTANLLDRPTFRAGIYWDFLFYLGAVLGLTGVVHQVHVDTWVIERLKPILEPMAEYPASFLLVTAVGIFAARFILPSFPLVSLLTLTVVPIAANAGIRPLSLILVICTTVAVWFLPYQSTYYLALYFGTKEKAFTHGQVRVLAWSYGLIYLLAICVAIPYWRLLGLLR
ncbi:MAG TPA: SLC13 family permease [Candidatus Binatia bacterium]|nr:SLC13 family permease [Candidatus Binatia bacterium]